MNEVSGRPDPDTMSESERLKEVLFLAYGVHWRQHAPDLLGFKASYLQKVIDGDRPVSAGLRIALVSFCRGETMRIHRDALERIGRLDQIWMSFGRDRSNK